MTLPQHALSLSRDASREGESRAEDLANALDDAKDLDGWIDDGGHYATFRATFADTVALQFLTGSEEETIELADQLEGLSLISSSSRQLCCSRS